MTDGTAVLDEQVTFLEARPVKPEDGRLSNPSSVCGWRGATLYIAPCLHADWPSFTINYRYRETVCYIAVSQISGDDVSARARKRDG